jgi:hypothetical protein
VGAEDRPLAWLCRIARRRVGVCGAAFQSQKSPSLPLHLRPLCCAPQSKDWKVEGLVPSDPATNDGRFRTRYIINLNARFSNPLDLNLFTRHCGTVTAESSHSALTPLLLFPTSYQTLPSEMLKRQRASSPSPLTQTPATEVPLISSVPTSSEHGVKRRRLLAPPLDGRSRGWGMLPVPSEGEVEEDDIMEDDSPNPWATTTEPSLSGAGEYKAVNSLLHDLHAEQQHRRLMSPSSHSSSSSPGSFSSQGWPSSTPQEPPAGKLNVMSIPSPNPIQAEKYRQGLHASETKDKLFCDDDASVFNRYGETNRSA